jgi:hypothetical protein
MKKDGTEEGGDCFDPDKESGMAADESRAEQDRYHAALSYIFYLLAGFDVGGILGCSRSGSAAYLNNRLIHDFCENKTKPKDRSCYHPAWCVRKCTGLLELVSGVAPATSTRPKTTKDGKGRVKNAPSNGRKEEVKLVYKMIEPYFVALKGLTENKELNIGVLFEILESSDTYRPMFMLVYSSLVKDPAFTSLTADIVALTKNAKSVAIAKGKVFCSHILIQACSNKVCDKRRSERAERTIHESRSVPSSSEHSTSRAQRTWRGPTWYKSTEIFLVDSLHVVTPITLDDSFTMGVVNISTKSRVLGSIVTRMNRNQKKSLKKLADQVGMSAGEKVAIAKVLLQGHVKAGILYL